MVTTVTGYTAARMKEIEDNTIVDAVVVDGDLILTRYDGTQVNVGSVAGPTGPPASFAGYSEPMNDLGDVSGTVTLDFSTYNVWRINPTANVDIAFSNFPPSGEIVPVSLIVANSTYDLSWPAGTKFVDGTIPTLSGETWLAIIGRDAYATVGTTWTGVA